MTITIELTDDLANRLADAGIPPEDASRYAVSALEEAAESIEVRAWWEKLGKQGRLTEIARTEESRTAADSGLFSAAEDVYARIRARRSSTPSA